MKCDPSEQKSTNSLFSVIYFNIHYVVNSWSKMNFKLGKSVLVLFCSEGSHFTIKVLISSYLTAIDIHKNAGKVVAKGPS